MFQTVGGNSNYEYNELWRPTWSTLIAPAALCLEPAQGIVIR